MFEFKICQCVTPRSHNIYRFSIRSHDFNVQMLTECISYVFLHQFLYVLKFEFSTRERMFYSINSIHAVLAVQLKNDFNFVSYTDQMLLCVLVRRYSLLKQRQQLSEEHIVFRQSHHCVLYNIFIQVE